MKSHLKKNQWEGGGLPKAISFLVIAVWSVIVTLGSQSDLESKVKVATLQEFRGIMQRAEAGNKEAQYYTGRAYHFGQVVSRDPSEAMKWYQKAAEQGFAPAEFSLSQMLLNGEGCSKDSVAALKWLRKAAEHGHPQAQFTIGYAIEQQGDSKEAAKWYRKAADQGFGMAQNGLGFFYEQGRGVKQDYQEAARWYRKAAEQGDSNAQSNLGNLYADGKGVSQDYTEAAKWFRLSAEKGWAVGQANLAGAYMLGRGVPRDFDNAYMWCSLAIAGGEQGSKSALQILTAQMTTKEVDEAKQRVILWSKEHQQSVQAQGGFYGKGAKDTPKSWKEIQVAAESGDAKAQTDLGEIYYRSQNYQEALKWFRKSAEQGYPYGQYNLGVLYFEGSGVVTDPCSIS